MARDPKREGKPTAASPAEVTPVITQAEEYVATVLARTAYSRERYLLMTRIVAGLGACLFLSMGINLYLATRPVQYRFIPTDISGKIRNLTALNTPVMSESEIATWLTAAVTRAFTFDYVNYRDELTAAKDNFTPPGWKSFEAALDQSNILKSVIANRLVTTAAPTAAPILEKDGLIEGRYAWRFKLPIIVTFKGGGTSGTGGNTMTLNLSVVVVRMPETEQANGVGIAMLIAGE